MNKNFYKNHLKLFQNLIQIDSKIEQKLDLTIKTILDLKKKGKKIIICGNGGSAAIASHVSIDLLKNLKIQSIPLTDSSLITCFASPPLVIAFTAIDRTNIKIKNIRKYIM